MTSIEVTESQQGVLDAVGRWFATSGRAEGGGRAGEFYLAGYAGTGKTTLASHFLSENRLDAVTATFTGKAAHVLRQKGVSDARTIHSMAYEPVPGSSPPEFRPRPLEESPLHSADILVLDEVSMVPDDMADDLRAYGVPMLVLGDPGQLPPIRGTGAFTRRDPDAFLTEIHRQASGSPILRLAAAAREGRPIPPCRVESELGDVLVCDYDRSHILRAREAGGAIICGVHRHRWGMTSVLRREVAGVAAPYPLAGEPVMCCRNNPEMGLFNGMSGVATEDAQREGRYVYLKVRMDGREFDQELTCDPVLFDEHRRGMRLEEPRYDRYVHLFDYGYVLTCHKSQGSEWEDVTILDDSRFFRGDADRWLYTACTRASRRVTLMRRG